MQITISQKKEKEKKKAAFSESPSLQILIKQLLSLSIHKMDYLFITF